MDEVIERLGPALVTDAVVVWTGFGAANRPRREESDVVARFGAEAAAELLPVVRQLEDDFYASTAHATAADLAEMEQSAAADFRSRHPDLPADIARAFAWCYSYDYK